MYRPKDCDSNLDEKNFKEERIHSPSHLESRITEKQSYLAPKILDFCNGYSIHRI